MILWSPSICCRFTTCESGNQGIEYSVQQLLMSKDCGMLRAAVPLSSSGCSATERKTQRERDHLLFSKYWNWTLQPSFYPNTNTHQPWAGAAYQPLPTLQMMLSCWLTTEWEAVAIYSSLHMCLSLCVGMKRSVDSIWDSQKPPPPQINKHAGLTNMTPYHHWTFVHFILLHCSLCWHMFILLTRIKIHISKRKTTLKAVKNTGGDFLLQHTTWLVINLRAKWIESTITLSK